MRAIILMLSAVLVGCVSIPEDSAYYFVGESAKSFARPYELSLRKTNDELVMAHFGYVKYQTEHVMRLNKPLKSGARYTFRDLVVYERYTEGGHKAVNLISGDVVVDEDCRYVTVGLRTADGAWLGNGKYKLD